MNRFMMIKLSVLALIVTLGFSAVLIAPASLAKCQGFDCVNEELEKKPTIYGTSYSSDVNPLSPLAKTITETLLYVVGAGSIIMLIYGGIQYTTSSGNQEKTKKAKDIIMYALIGLAVSLLAFAIINFVITKINP